jgi:endonuclease G
VSFWKIIAFIHDRTGKLCATGYEMSQEANLEQREFVFVNYQSPQLNLSTQVSIASIEQKAGIHFGGLAGWDPLDQEAPGGSAMPLLRFEQIRFE